MHLIIKCMLDSKPINNAVPSEVILRLMLGNLRGEKQAIMPLNSAKELSTEMKKYKVMYGDIRNYDFEREFKRIPTSVDSLIDY